MKERKANPIVCSLAVLVLAPVAARAQEDEETNAGATSAKVAQSSQVPHDKRRDVNSTHRVFGFSNNAESGEQALRREIDALEAASAQKRAQLEERLAEIKRKRELEAKVVKDAASNWAAAQNAYRSALQPVSKWMIGVHVSATPSDGVKVEDLLDGMPAAKAGIEKADVIESVNDIRVREVGSLNAIINAAADQELQFGIRRGEERIELSITPSKTKAAEPVGSALGTGRATPLPGGSLPHLDLRVRPDQHERAQVFEWIAPGNKSAREGRRGPDTAELQALKQEISELRQLVEKIAASVGDDSADADVGEGNEATEDEAEGEDEDEDN